MLTRGESLARAQPLDWTPRARLLRPRPATDAVLDPRLFASLIASAEGVPLTLISAQAGSGKTTLAAAVAADVAQRRPVGWITLTSRDDHLDGLLALLGAALESVIPGGVRIFADLVRAHLPAASDPRRAVGVLVNDILAADPPPFLLVLDDLHELRDAAVMDALDELVSHPPAALHVLATARTDPRLPLARLRARGQLAEARAGDLRLSPRQAEVLLNDRLGLGLSAEEVERVVSLAGGWATGVRLLGRSLGRGADHWPRTRLQPGAEPDALFDYLAEEVWAHEPAEVRDFLLATAVLDELTPRACAAVSGRSDAEALLESLRRRNHFLVVAAAPSEEARYRYHDLFAAFLRRQLAREGGPERSAALHRRAATVAGSPPQRVEHLLAAGDADAAADEIERLGRAAFARPSELLLVVAWIERLPRATRAARPWLEVLVGLADAQQGRFEPAARRLEGVLDAPELANDFLGTWLAARTLHLVTNDHARYVPRLAALEASAGFSGLPGAAQVDHHLSNAYAAAFTGRRDETARRLCAALDLTIASGDPGAVEVLAQHLSPLLATGEGVMEYLEAYTAWVADRFRDASPLARLGLHHQRAFVHLLRGRLGEALAEADAAGDLVERLGGLPYLRSTLDWARAGAWFARGDLGAAEALLAQRLREPGPTDLDRALMALPVALLARLLRRQQRLVELRHLATTSGALTAATRYVGQAALVRAAVRSHAARAEGDVEAALAALREALDLEDRLPLTPFVGSARVDLACLWQEAGVAEQALAEIGTALGEARARGTVDLVVLAGSEVVPLLRRAAQQGVEAETARAALRALGEAAGPREGVPLPGLAEALSPREMEVLRLLAEGVSNPRLADLLVVSPNTVKTHVGRVLSKLGARSRSEAVARARALRLL